LALQLYVSTRDENYEQRKQLVRRARQLGATALAITVDTPVVGKREADERAQAEQEMSANADGDSSLAARRALMAASPVLRGVNYKLNWDDLKWIREAWGSGPIYLKGIQCVEDAIIAMRLGCQGIYLSNHGGRQLDCAPSSLTTLLEIRKFAPEVLEKMEVYMDGGIRRGADIVKALCLGATGVAMGRPFMYGAGAYGVDGCEKVIQIIGDEIETTMRLIGATSLDQLKPYMVNAKAIENELPNEITPMSVITSKL